MLPFALKPCLTGNKKKNLFNYCKIDSRVCGRGNKDVLSNKM